MVVVAGDHDDRDPGVGDGLEALGEGALLRRRRVGGAVGVSTEKKQVDVFVEPAPDHELEASFEIEQARVEAGFRVDPPVRITSEMNVGGVEDFHGQGSKFEVRSSKFVNEKP